MIVIKSIFANCNLDCIRNYHPSKWHPNKKSFKLQFKIQFEDFISDLPLNIHS